MAKIHEEIILIKFSKLIKESDQPASAVNQELLDSLIAVAEELAGAGIIIEIERV